MTEQTPYEPLLFNPTDKKTLTDGILKSYLEERDEFDNRFKPYKAPEEVFDDNNQLLVDNASVPDEEKDEKMKFGEQNFAEQNAEYWEGCNEEFSNFYG